MIITNSCPLDKVSWRSELLAYNVYFSEVYLNGQICTNKRVSIYTDASIALSFSMFSGPWNCGQNSNFALKLERS